ncbi:hypothetical protein RO3G_06021 [Rhizopus delemar RA 99-880]|uniref:Exopolygalacturonase rpg16 n=1 Tax=Rhizopus delemar (strain RA 99-880 / ATCC MYA-4621 / FGSC 9543 / NRRL 43880) TaxID=246409 RepID=RPG16_RHIO9|nr:RecName: Full=Exopolygalacturonase rpg16; AltName: Full=Galacturan 1,4-alpha-galacturonidase rpg16; AltName: Full=Poly(1,4-alpha-D-galacturonide)galacturonohydrolase rpg16; Flags: Precursor [Rhizopus delemar RA 99-880]EIE81316.1 hypothetical protein RO3G_06021 [Rhizopus delemar RA 99-880]|eukprot:EIE81316.1 hypothetical protein RO3G_06021 [Rhizopus delemar RA 99-880]
MVRFTSFTSPFSAILLLSFGINKVATASTNTCVVAKSDSDDAITILEAFEKCKTGGTVVFPKDSTYNLNSIVTTSGLKNVNINLAGTINLPVREESYRNGDYYIQIKGTNIKMYGGGTINGNGQAWWDALDRTAPSVLRIAANDSSFGNFNIINSPRAHLNVTNSTNLLLHDFIIHTVSNNSNPAKNTDALDLYHSSGVIFRDSDLTIGDDCLAVKENVTKVTVSNITCRGGHGYSIGSLGMGGRRDFVTQVNVYNSTCIDCQNGVRVKTWAGGKGFVEDINFTDIYLEKAENPIIITTHYCDKNEMGYCNNNYETSLDIAGVHFKNIHGSGSDKGKPIINLNCSTESPCSDVTLTNINISKASNNTKNVCVNLKGSDKIPECSS